MQHVTHHKTLNHHFHSGNRDNAGLLPPKHNAQGKPQSMTKPLRVLVVEDEPINQKVAKLLLEGKNYQVDIAPTGQAALTLYQTKRYAAILMDMGLPDIAGTEVTRQIRALEQLNKMHTPIIALTANGLGVKSACLAAGMDDFLLKPFEIETLNQLLKNWIEKTSYSPTRR